MTLEELQNETLCQKNRRLLQAKCPHKEIYMSAVTGPDGTVTNSFCWDCGKSWRHEEPTSITTEQIAMTPARETGD